MLNIIICVLNTVESRENERIKTEWRKNAYQGWKSIFRPELWNIDGCCCCRLLSARARSTSMAVVALIDSTLSHSYICHSMNCKTINKNRQATTIFFRQFEEPWFRHQFCTSNSCENFNLLCIHLILFIIIYPHMYIRVRKYMTIVVIYLLHHIC